MRRIVSAITFLYRISKNGASPCATFRSAGKDVLQSCNRNERVFIMSRMSSVVSVALLAAALGGGLPGCGGGSSTSVTRPAGFNPDGRVVPNTSNLATLKVTISTDKSTYKVGEAINMTVSVNNTSSGTSSITFPTAAHATWWGFLIAQNGKIVTYEYWTGHNQAFPQVLGSDTYASGETHTFPWTFPYVPSAGSQPQTTTLPAGVYQVYARLPDIVYDNGTKVSSDVPTPISDPVTITVVN